MRARYAHLYAVTCIAFFMSLAIAWQGTSRELLSNSVYIQLIETFPAGLNFRVEPLYVSVLWLTSFLLGPALSIIVWRFILLWLQLFFFSRIFQTLNASRLVTLAGLFMYGTSTVAFSLADNLLRNDAALTAMLGLLALFTSISRKASPAWKWAALGSGVGACFYIHMFMGAILVCTLACYAVANAAFSAYKNRHVAGKSWKAAALAVACAVFVSLPYTLQLSGRADLSDYTASSGASDATPIETAVPTQTVSSVDEPAETPPAKRTWITFVRLLFEYRDTNLSIGLMAAVAISIVSFFFKRRLERKEVVLALSLWLVCYAGTKLDFFGIGTVPYRFSLILSIASLFVLLLGLSLALQKLTSRNAKLLLVMAVIASYLGRSLPLIAENYVLKTDSFATFQLEAERRIIQRSVPPASRVIQFGTSLESFRHDIAIIDLRTPFEKNSRTAQKDLEANKIDFLLLSDAVEEQKASLDSEGSSHDIEAILSNPSYRLVDVELFGPHALYLLSTHKDDTALPYAFTRIQADEPASAEKLEEAIGQETIQAWSVSARQDSLEETVRLATGTVRIGYPSGATLSQSQLPGLERIEPKGLVDLPARSEVPVERRWYFTSRQGDVAAWTEFAANSRYVHLSDYSRDTISVTANISSWENLGVSYVSRTLFQFSLHVLIAIATIAAYMGMRKREEPSAFPRWLTGAVIFLGFDLLVLSQLVFHYYSKLIQ